MITKENISRYFEAEKDTVVAELEGKGFEVAEEGMFIFGTWSVTLQRGDERVELLCDAIEQEELDEGTIAPEDAEWWVQLIKVWDAKDREGTERTYPDD